MSFFNSKSSSSTTANEVGQQTGGPAVVLNDITRSKNLTVNVESTDVGAVDAAFQFAGGAGEHYSELSQQNTEEFLLWSAGFGEAVLEHAGDITAESNKLMLATLEEVGTQSENAIEAVNASGERALLFGAGAIEKIDAAANRNALFSAGAIEHLTESAKGQQAGMQSMFDKAMTFVAGAFQANTAASADARTDIANAYGDTFAALEKAHQSETAQLSERGLYAVMFLGAVAGFMAWRANQ